MNPVPAVKPAASRDPYPDDTRRWNAVLRRDFRAEGSFVYSVKTTGVYCRPSCRSRMPRRENVAFYDSSEEAERAGFRPCKRCQPDGPDLTARHAETVARACAMIETADKPPSLEALARQVGMSRFHFHRIFRKLTGLTPKGYAAAHRAETMRRTLPRSGSVTEAIYEAGYGSNGRFYAKASETLGMRPQAFRKGGEGVAVRFAVGECSLGSILVASSDKGVCAIFLGDDPGELVRVLQDRFPKANLIGGDRDYERVVAAIVGFVEEPRAKWDLPLDVRGTVFQQKVWRALREIPIGTTASYGDIARRIGIPKAVRAVAQACGANLLAVVIPCHRVVRTDGGISGYRWGVERKKALLRKESGGRSAKTALSARNPKELRQAR